MAEAFTDQELKVLNRITGVQKGLCNNNLVSIMYTTLKLIRLLRVEYELLPDEIEGFIGKYKEKLTEKFDSGLMNALWMDVVNYLMQEFKPIACDLYSKNQVRYNGPGSVYARKVESFNYGYRGTKILHMLLGILFDEGLRYKNKEMYDIIVGDYVHGPKYSEPCNQEKIIHWVAKMCVKYDEILDTLCGTDTADSSIVGMFKKIESV